MTRQFGNPRAVPPVPPPMPMSLIEWTVRMTMLVLAGLVTLAILGSIAAMSTDPGTGGFPGERVFAPDPEPTAREQAAAPSPSPAKEQAPGTAPAAGQATVAGEGGTIVAAAPPPERPQRWLEAIAYALLGLAGLCTIGLIILWQLLRQLRRIADAAEARPRNL